MSESDVTRAALTYAVVWTVAAFVGLGAAGIGVTRWLLPAYSRYLAGEPTATVLEAAAPGLVLALVGVLVWKVASVVVLYRTIATAFAVETASRLNTEAMKSDILAVLDERLADMKQDTQRTRRAVEGGRADGGDDFDFADE